MSYTLIRIACACTHIHTHLFLTKTGLYKTKYYRSHVLTDILLGFLKYLSTVLLGPRPTPASAHLCGPSAHHAL